MAGIASPLILPFRKCFVATTLVATKVIITNCRFELTQEEVQGLLKELLVSVSMCPPPKMKMGKPYKAQSFIAK
jgi:hypothetical protein